MDVLGGIEAGGTKFVCGIGTGPDDLKVISFPTAEPESTVRQAAAFFLDKTRPRIAALGIACFGPVDLAQKSPAYGCITTTPKSAWRNFNIVDAVAKAVSVPVAFETDVNAAALAEAKWGAAKDVEDCVYITVGTGIGGGVVVRGRPIHGMLHPEIGHVRVARHKDDTYPGSCPFHGDCLEGLASGPALSKRWGSPPESLPAAHPAWELEAYYLASAVSTIIYTVSPRRIILGGGVMQQPILFPLIRRNVTRLINGYIATPQVSADIDRYIVPPQLGKHSGVLGSILLAGRIHKS